MFAVASIHPTIRCCLHTNKGSNGTLPVGEGQKGKKGMSEERKKREAQPIQRGNAPENGNGICWLLDGIGIEYMGREEGKKHIALAHN